MFPTLLEVLSDSAILESKGEPLLLGRMEPWSTLRQLSVGDQGLWAIDPQKRSRSTSFREGWVKDPFLPSRGEH